MQWSRKIWSRMKRKLRQKTQKWQRQYSWQECLNSINIVQQRKGWVFWDMHNFLKSILQQYEDT